MLHLSKNSCRKWVRGFQNPRYHYYARWISRWQTQKIHIPRWAGMDLSRGLIDQWSFWGNWGFIGKYYDLHSSRVEYSALYHTSRSSIEINSKDNSYSMISWLEDYFYVYRFQAYMVAVIETRLDKWMQYIWCSIYSSINSEQELAIDKLWDHLLPAHGIVAVDYQWAVERQMSAIMSLPSHLSKGIYIIDAYHQLHCLVSVVIPKAMSSSDHIEYDQTIVRKTFYEISRNETLTYPLGHSIHCFDSLRQYVMCTAGDTLLYSWGRNVTGDGQLRKCRS